MQFIRSEAHWQVVLWMKWAILFCHAEWSVPSVNSLKAFERWEQDWRLELRTPVIDLLIVTLDKQPFAREWFSEQGHPDLQKQGFGEVFWIESGKIVHRLPFFKSSDELTVRTLNLWGDRASKGAASAKARPLGVPLSEATKRRMEVLFKDGELARATELLVNYCGNNLPLLEKLNAVQLERFRFAALKSSGGRIDRLVDAICLGQMDWRDLLVAADFAEDIHAHEKWFPANPIDET